MIFGMPHTRIDFSAIVFINCSKTQDAICEAEAQHLNLRVKLAARGSGESRAHA